MGALHLRPGFAAAPSGLRQSDRHLGRHAVAAVQQLRKRLARYAKPRRDSGDRQTERLEAVLPNNLARARRVYASPWPSRPSMVLPGAQQGQHWDRL